TPAPALVDGTLTRTRGAKAVVAIGWAIFDADGDGYSPFFGGPDCDDTRADVNPGAAEIPDNGVDDNCLGGDRTAEAPADDAGAGTLPAAATTRRLGFDGNLVFIAIDTLRADRLGVAGYQRDGRSLTPNLDKLVAESVYFERAWAQSPNTPRSFPSM